MKEVMNNTTGVVQNLGWIDRVLRVIAGVLFLAVPISLLKEGQPYATWYYYLILLSVVPMITGILGWCPFYAGFHMKSCDTSKRNRCGTFTEEMKAAVGKPASEGDNKFAA